MKSLFARDLDSIVAQTPGIWSDLRDARVFITGGTGLFGCWLLESLLRADARCNLGVKVAVLTRSPGAFAAKAPHLAGHRSVCLHEGDVRDFRFPRGDFSHVIHAATESCPTKAVDTSRILFETIVEGTRRTLQFARKSGASRLLFISSGAVYGRQPHELTHIGEEYLGAPDPTDPLSAYGEGKRAGEHLIALAHHAGGLGATIARCFTFVGPHLPLDAHFAIGNFIRDGLAGGPIRVTGDGTPRRSYMYMADLSSWLWTILLRGVPCRPYNVGSEEDLSIADLARRVAKFFGTTVTVPKQPDAGVPCVRYVPSTVRARTELGLRYRINLEDALARTVGWLRGSVRCQPLPSTTLS